MTELDERTLRRLLAEIAERAANATLMTRELRTRLAGLDLEREQWLHASTEPDLAPRARLELNEVEALRPRVERTGNAWSDKARALELIAGSCVLEAAQHPYRRRRPPPAPEVRVDVTAPLPVVWPDAGPEFPAENVQGMSAYAAVDADDGIA